MKKLSRNKVSLSVVWERYEDASNLQIACYEQCSHTCNKFYFAFNHGNGFSIEAIGKRKIQRTCRNGFLRRNKVLNLETIKFNVRQIERFAYESKQIVFLTLFARYIGSDLFDWIGN